MNLNSHTSKESKKLRGEKRIDKGFRKDKKKKKDREKKRKMSSDSDRGKDKKRSEYRKKKCSESDSAQVRNTIKILTLNN